MSTNSQLIFDAVYDSADWFYDRYKNGLETDEGLKNYISTIADEYYKSISAAKVEQIFKALRDSTEIELTEYVNTCKQDLIRNSLSKCIK